MELNRKQEEGLKIAVDRYKQGEKYTVISGYAGSGKSTLIKFIISALGSLGINPDRDVCNVAFTGKAATVLQKKGNANCMTLHKLLYEAKMKPDGKFIFMPKSSIDYKIAVVDECSMLTQKMVDALLRHDVYVIFCGDPGQLPPIDKKNAAHLLDHPHIFLDEIMRQAKESEIIRLSMDIREGKPLAPFKGENVQIFRRKELLTGMLTWADVVLCATNDTRNSLNSQIRSLKGFTKPIEENEKLICLKNNWDLFSSSGNALTNGIIGNLHDWFESYIKVPGYIGVPNNKIPIIIGNYISDDGDDYGLLEIDKTCLLTGKNYLTDRQKYLINSRKNTQGILPQELTYGYAITTWKAQGSEWDKVLLFEERHPWDKKEHIQYLYTGLTRSQDKAVIILKD